MADEFDDMDDIDKMLEGGGDIGMEDPMANDGKPSTGVVGDVKAALDDAVTSENIAKSFKKSMFNALPGDIGDRLGDAEYAVDNILDNASEKVGSVKKAASAGLGVLSNYLPDSMTGGINSVRDWLSEENESSGSEREPTEDEKIHSEVSGLLGIAGDKIAAQQNVAAQATEIAAKESNEILGIIASNSQKQVELKMDLDNTYYKKNLELQMKQTYTLVKLYNLLHRDSEIRTTQMEAIVKNTGLPDFVKTRSSDFVKQQMMKKAADGVGNLIKSTSTFDKVTKNMNRLVNDKVSSFVSSMAGMEDMDNMLAMGEEFGTSRNAMLMSIGVDGLIESITKKASDKIVSGIAGKGESGKRLGELNNLTLDPREAIKREIDEIEAKDDKDTTRVDKVKLKSLKVAYDLLENDKSKNTIDVSKTSELNEAAFIDNKFVKTVEVIIPGLLSKMLGELSTIRKGSKTVSGEDKQVFDFRKNTFTSETKLKKEFKKKVEEKGKRLADALDNDIIFEIIIGKKNPKPEVKSVIMQALLAYIGTGKSLVPAYLVKNGFLKTIQDKELKEKIEKHLNKLNKNNSAENIDKINEFFRVVNSIEDRELASYGDIIQESSLAGGPSMLEDSGVFDKGDLSRTNGTTVLKTNKNVALKHIEEKFNKKVEEAEEKPEQSKPRKRVTSANRKKGQVRQKKTSAKRGIVAGLANLKPRTSTSTLLPEDPVALASESTGPIIKTKIADKKNKEDKDSNTIRTDVLKKLENLLSNVKISAGGKTPIAQLIGGLGGKEDNYVDKIVDGLPVRFYEASAMPKTMGAAALLQGNEEGVNPVMLRTDMFRKVAKNGIAKNTMDDQTIRHEAAHLKRGIPLNPPPSMLDSEKGLANGYFKEEQEINSRVAPKVFKIYNDNYSDPKFKEVLAANGASMFFNRDPQTFMTMMERAAIEEPDNANAYIDMVKKHGKIDFAVGNIEDYKDEYFNRIKNIDYKGESTYLKDFKENTDTGKEILNKIENKLTTGIDTVTEKAKELDNKYNLTEKMEDVSKGVKDLVTDKKLRNFSYSTDNKGLNKLAPQNAYETKFVMPDKKKLIDGAKKLDEELGISKKAKDIGEQAKKKLEQAKNSEEGRAASNIAKTTKGLFTKQTAKDLKFTADGEHLNRLSPQQAFENKLAIPNREKLSKFKDDISEDVGVLVDSLKTGLEGIAKTMPKSFEEVSTSFSKNLERVSKKFPELSKSITDAYANSMSFISDQMLGLKDSETLKDLKDENGNFSMKAALDNNPKLKAIEEKTSKWYGEVKSMFTSGSKGASDSIIKNSEEFEKLVEEQGFDKVMKSLLGNLPMPEDYSKAKSLYKKTFLAMDPTGNLWKKLNEDDKFLENVTKLHEEAIEEVQEKALEEGSENEDGKPTSLVGKMKSKLSGLIPKPVKDMVNKLANTKIGKYAINQTKRVGRAFKTAGKLTMDEMKVIGKNGKELIMDKDGKLHLPNAIDLAKFAGKSYFGSMKAVSNGVKSLYPELGGIAKDTIGLGSGMAFGMASKSLKRIKNKALAKINPPVRRDLYTAWANGDLKAKEVLEQLETPEEKEKWTAWLKENTRPGLDIGKVLNATGGAYVKGMMLTSKVIKPTYKGAWSAAKTVGGLGLKGAYKFSGVDTIFDHKKKETTDNNASATGVIDFSSFTSKNPLEAIAANTKKLFEVTSSNIAKENEEEAQAKEEAKEASKLDKDGDGDRDGNEQDRLKKLYGKKPSGKMKALLGKGKNVLKKASSWLTPTNILLAGTAILGLLGITPEQASTFVKSTINGFKTIGHYIKKVWDGLETGFDYIKHLPSNLSFSLRSALSHIPGLGSIAPDKKETVEYNKRMGIDVTSTTTSKEDSMTSDGGLAGAAGVTALAAGAAYKLGGKHVIKAGIGATKLAYKGAKYGVKAVTKVAGKKVVKEAAKKTVVKKAKRGAIKAMLSRIKVILIKKLGVKGAAKLLGKIASRFVPFVGWSMLAYDAYHVVKYMYDGMPFKSAVSKAVIGFDVFNSDDVPVDDNGVPIKPDIPESTINKEVQKMTGRHPGHDDYSGHRSANNSNYKGSLSSDDLITKKSVNNIYSKPAKPITSKDILGEIKVDKGFNKGLLLKNLVDDEGNVNRVYKDSLGYDTIGVGHLLDKAKGGVPLKKIIGRDTDVITTPESYKILAHDVNKTAKTLYSKLPWLDNQPEVIQRDLINMGFNLGPKGLLGFKKSLNNIAKGEYTEAGAELLKSKWASQVGHRATRIADDIANAPKADIEADVNNDRNTISSITGHSTLTELDDMGSGNTSIASTNTSTSRHGTTSKPSTKGNDVHIPNVSIDTKHLDNKKELAEMHDTHKASQNILAKSLHVHADTNNKMGELVELNKSILSALSDNNQHHQQANRTPATKPIVSHGVANF